MIQNSGPIIYTSEEKNSIEDYKFDSDFLRERTIERLKDHLEPVPCLVNSDLSMGNMVLEPDFARDYLTYLRNGGDLRVEGFYKFKWNETRPENLNGVES